VTKRIDVRRRDFELRHCEYHCRDLFYYVERLNVERQRELIAPTNFFSKSQALSGPVGKRIAIPRCGVAITILTEGMAP
jgi:hypothetical protein